MELTSNERSNLEKITSDLSALNGKEDFSSKMNLFFERYAGKVINNRDDPGYGYFFRVSTEGRAYFFNYAEPRGWGKVIGEPEGGPAGTRGQGTVSSFGSSPLKVGKTYIPKEESKEYVVVFNQTRDMTHRCRHCGHSHEHESYDYLFLAISREKLR